MTCVSLKKRVERSIEIFEFHLVAFQRFHHFDALLALEIFVFVNLLASLLLVRAFHSFFGLKNGGSFMLEFIFFSTFFLLDGRHESCREQQVAAELLVQRIWIFSML